MSHSKISGLDQFLHENQTWVRALDFYLQENSYLKTRLSHVLDTHIDKEFVDRAEYFQNCFIHIDECIKDMQKDILIQQRNLKEAVQKMQPDVNKIHKQQKKLRNEMGNFENDLIHVKNKFNQYLVSLVQD